MSKSYEEDYDSPTSSRSSVSAGLLNSEDVNKDFPLVAPRKRWITPARVHLAALYTILLVFTLQALKTWFSKPVDISLGNLYTPAKEVIEYEEIDFTWNFWDKGEYMGFPTDEKDKMWSDLYNFGTSGIPNEEAKKLPYPTVPVPDEPDKSLVMLDVWHQLHCLNTIRRMMYPERWPEIWTKHDDGTINYDTVEMLHIDHCIDHIRQTLQCFSDTAPTSFFYHPTKGNNPSPWGTHMCKNFDNLKEWSVERQIVHFSMHDKLGTGKKHDDFEIKPKGSGYGGSAKDVEGLRFEDVTEAREELGEVKIHM
ncbi:hypothetical protein HYALB_00010201 [Hymenoscyphus albidus]|uniref:Cyclochlorotine biosynthesis protein O n=1 Tax=Hymenoscyphus albidus TaxID=595503 RepID=A0A9N9Q645_9HELO|nr:hypothetical protein HYALB_00010201 [Hymenoscyphus albidus]